MLARLQQVSTLAIVVATVLWVSYFLLHDQAAWAGLGVLAFPLGFSVLLAGEFLLLAWVQSHTGPHRASARQLMLAWWTEVLTTPRVFCWLQPFRSRCEPDSIPESITNHRGVIFVHGFFCNRGLWNPWMASLRSIGIPFVAVNLEPVFGSIDNYAEMIEAAVQRLELVTTMAPVVIAHSMGGLAVRVWLRGDGNTARVHHVVTIGTPHRGTWLARFGRTVNGKQMRVNSAWLKALSHPDGHDRYAKFTCLYSNCDNIVFPFETATLPGARNLHVPGIAHVQLVFHALTLPEIRKWILPEGLYDTGSK